MGFQIETNISALTVFLQGLISFLSPCVLPLLPLYLGYLSTGAKTTDESGHIHYRQGRVLINTLFFVGGISFAFFLLGMGAGALGRFFADYQIWISRIGGLLIILFGLFQLGVFRSGFLSSEKRFSPRFDRLGSGPLSALILGFTFSFSWTPCVGPALASVLLMAAGSGNTAAAFFLIGVYTAGFCIPFLLVGLFTARLLDFFKKNRKVVSYTTKIGGILMLFMGIMMLTGWMNGLSSNLTGPPAAPAPQKEESSWEAAEEENPEASQPSGKEVPGETAEDAESSGGSSGNASSGSGEDAPSDSDGASPSDERELPDAPEFTLTDQFGNVHNLSDYKGKTIFLNFWATWCGPCKMEMPEIQALYEDWEENSGDLVVLGVAGPGSGREGDVAYITAFLEDNGYTFPVLMDETGILFYQFGITAFPTTFMITEEGKVYGYVSGALSREIMDSIIEQTME